MSQLASTFLPKRTVLDSLPQWEGSIVKNEQLVSVPKTSAPRMEPEEKPFKPTLVRIPQQPSYNHVFTPKQDPEEERKEAEKDALILEL